MNLIFKRASNSIPFLLGLTLGLYFITFNIVGITLTYFPGDFGDGRFNNYILEHAYRFFTGQADSFWNAPFMYPEPDVLSYSDNLLGTAPVYSFFRFIGCDRETAFQWWFIFMAVLSYTCTYFFLKDVFKNRYAAVVGAMVFAFSMALQSQMTHAQTFPRFPIPLAFWMAYLFILDFKPRFFFLTLFFVVYQYYCGIYLGLLLIIPISVMLLLGFVFYRDILIEKMNKEWIITITSFFTINILLSLPLLIPYIQRAQAVESNSFSYIFQTIPHFKSFIFSQSGSLLWNFLSGIGSAFPAWWDHQLFAGSLATLSVLIFSAVVIMRFIKSDSFPDQISDNRIVIMFITGLVTFFLFVRVSNFSFYRIIHALPGYDSLRSLTRVINIELIFFAFATAFVVKWVFSKSRIRPGILFLGIIALFILDNYYKDGKSYRSEKRLSQERIEELVIKMQNIPKGSIVSYEPTEVGSRSVELQLDAMLAAQSLNLKTVNGYSATSPGTYTDFWFRMDSVSRQKWFKAKELSVDMLYVIR